MTLIDERPELDIDDDVADALAPDDIDVWEMLSDEEACLYAILTDHAGIDTAEFLLVDEARPDGCYRAWDMHWPWYRAMDQQQIEQAGRAIGKSWGVRNRCLSFPFRQPGQEMVITAPQAMHVDSLTEQVETAFMNTRLLNEMLADGRSGVNHRPFKASFKNGARIIGRIPQRTGVGMKGCLVAGTMVETRGGLCPIEKVAVGDWVCTHEHRWRRVLEVHSYVGDTMRVNIDGHAGLVCSPEHPLYGRVGVLVDAMTEEDSDWLRADDIQGYLDQGEEVWVAATDRMPGNVCQFDAEDGHWYVRVLDITATDEQAEVFDLTVDEDHSYIADGVVVHNTHPVCLELDEGQDYPKQAWDEVTHTFNSKLPGAEWRIHGVPRGIPDKFQDLITKAPGNGFRLHRYTQVHRPTWTQEERQRILAQHNNSENNPEFRRNVYGDLGDSTNRIFDLRVLMRCVDSEEGSDYNLDEFFYRRISAEQVEDRVARGGPSLSEMFDRGEDLDEHTTARYAAALIEMCDFPERHKRYKVFWAGMDVGLTVDPSEIIVAAEYQPDAKERRENSRVGLGVPLDGASRLKQLVRISLERIPYPLQVELLLHLIGFYRPRAFALDKGGIGKPILQGLQVAAHTSRVLVIDDSDDENLPPAERDARRARVEEARKTLTVIKGYDFGSKVVVDIDEAEANKLPAGLTNTEIADKAGIRANAKEWATDSMRALVEKYRLFLPYDQDAIQQLNGQTWQYSNAPTDAYGRRRVVYSIGVDHVFDAWRMLTLGYVQAPIEAFLSTAPKKRAPILARW